jgi:hypothetical protein
MPPAAKVNVPVPLLRVQLAALESMVLSAAESATVPLKFVYAIV